MIYEKLSKGKEILGFKQKGTTLPEILITLGIIGMIFTVVVQTISFTVNDIRTTAQLKKIYSIGEDITLSTSNQSIGYRFGIGGEYIFNQHFGLKTMLRYIKLTDDKIINDMIELSTGVKYYF